MNICEQCCPVGYDFVDDFHPHLGFHSLLRTSFYPSFLVGTLNELSQVTYALTKHELNIAIIFSSLQLFNVRLVDSPNRGY